MTVGQWAAATGFALLSVTVAVGVGAPTADRTRVPGDQVRRAQSGLAGLARLPERPAHDSAYSREAFGSAWTDSSGAPWSGNGCDTRNDILARDLEVSGRVAIASCPRAVSSGVLTSPYTGRQIVFERGRSSAAVQIDHVVPLSYAWDLGASRWAQPQRVRFANDPANLVAVDGGSNMAKSDAEPAVWMPPLDDFACQYAAQFVSVLVAYRLPVDDPSHRVLTVALDRC